MIRWGILGAGKIAKRFAKSLSHVEGTELVAISARNDEKAKSFTEENCKDAKSYSGDGCHEKLLSDTNVDAIYLALPHQLHYEWAVRALSAKKSVLCEKPAMMSVKEMQEVADAARKNEVLFMEAMKTRFMPVYKKFFDEIEKGVIGEVTEVTASLCNEMPIERISKTYHTDPVSGGVLFDTGIYCASWIEAIFSGEIKIIDKSNTIKNGAEFYVCATMDVGGKKAVLECAFDRVKPHTVTIIGTKGKITIYELHRPVTMTVEIDGQEPYKIDAPYKVDDLFDETDHFCKCIKNGVTESSIMSLDDSIRCAQILEVIKNK